MVIGMNQGLSQMFDHTMTAVSEEIFGRVVVAMKFKDEKEAIKLANDTIYGLGSAVWTKDQARATRVANEIKAGIVMIKALCRLFRVHRSGAINNLVLTANCALKHLIYTQRQRVFCPTTEHAL
jgi:acyl-CoA reductase-like NAD-dependent aldehyde dehydrogenase